MKRDSRPLEMFILRNASVNGLSDDVHTRSARTYELQRYRRPLTGWVCGEMSICFTSPEYGREIQTNRKA